MITSMLGHSLDRVTRNCPTGYLRYGIEKRILIILFLIFPPFFFFFFLLSR